jgi:hypothetical protein
MSFLEHNRALSLADTELLTRIVARAQNALPVLATAVERFCENEFLYWDAMLQRLPTQRVINAAISLVGLKDLDFIGDFSVTMELWEALNELGALLHMVCRLERNELSQLLLQRMVARLEKMVNETLIVLTRERLLWAWTEFSPPLLSSSAVEGPVPISL